jgi:hypothetical protein
MAGKDLSNALHMSWRERIPLPNLKARVPGPRVGRSLLLERESFSLLGWCMPLAWDIEAV